MDIVACGHVVARQVAGGNRQVKNLLLATCYLFLLVGIALTLVACGTGGQGSSSTAATPTPLPTPVVPEKPTYVVERGRVVKTLEFIGRVSPVMEQELFFKTDGFVADVYFSRGDQVQTGDLLAELEIGDLQNRLAQQEVALKTTEITLAKAEQDNTDQLLEAEVALEKLLLQMEQDQADPDNSSIVSARVNLQAAERELAEAQEDYDNAWDSARDWEAYVNDPTCLPGQGGPVPCTGETHHDRLERDRATSEIRLARAQDNLTIAKAEYGDAFASRNADDFTLQILEKDIELAEHRIEQLQRGVDPLLELEVERAQLEIEDTERQIADARLIAPFDGQLLSVGVRPGDNASAFDTIIVLADPSQLEITAELGGDELSEMSVGQEAMMRLRSRPEQDFAGSVRQLPYPYGGGTVETSEEDTAVRIAFADPDVELELGELATVIIMLEEKEGVLWLPPAAIRTFQGRTFVVVQDEEGNQQRVDVRLGIEGEDRVEILEGLEEGQVVVGE
jgi:RND family efflux transporter MFP subunit